jgi:hypothetical protein
MSTISVKVFFFIVLLLHAKGFSQDKIYLKSVAKQARISDVTSSTVTYYASLHDTKPVSLPISSILLAFNEKGDFLAPQKLDFSQKQTLRFIDHFLHPDSRDLNIDHVFTKDKKKIDGSVLSENDSAVFISVNNANSKVLKSTIVAIIYKDGHHHLYVPASSACNILWDIKLKGDSSLDSNLSYATKKPDKGNPIKDSHTVQGMQSNESQTDSSANKILDTARKLTFEDFAKDVTKEQFIKKATDKTQRFTEYLKILYDKSADNQQKNKTIEQAITLFVDENAEVEVSSISREEGVKHYKIRKYLQHVKLVNYDKIDIEWTNVQYVSDVRKGQDGNYYGTVEFEQVFKGYRDAQLVYSDITRKTANVVMKTYEKNYEGKATVLWDVLLSNIGVVSTKSL